MVIQSVRLVASYLEDDVALPVDLVGAVANLSACLLVQLTRETCAVTEACLEVDLVSVLHEFACSCGGQGHAALVLVELSNGTNGGVLEHTQEQLVVVEPASLAGVGGPVLHLLLHFGERDRKARESARRVRKGRM